MWWTMAVRSLGICGILLYTDSLQLSQFILASLSLSFGRGRDHEVRSDELF
jgi:hypothetical protein